MEYRHCKYTVTGEYVCNRNKKIETFANMATPSTKIVATPAPTKRATVTPSVGFSCPNYASMSTMKKRDTACSILQRYDMKEVNNFFACSSRDPVDGMITCKNKDIINSCVPKDKRLMECNRCCPSVDPSAPALTREAMQTKRDNCMLSCKRDHDPSSLVVKSAEVKIDPSLKADPTCLGERQRQTQCYTPQCKSQFEVACIKAGRTLQPATAKPLSSDGSKSSSVTADINCTNACKKQVGCNYSDKSCTEKCSQQCIKAGYIAPSAAQGAATMAPKLMVNGHTCSGVCKKKPGCTGMDCDMMCEFKCTF